jgi:AcrR family transcriptional regulator
MPVRAQKLRGAPRGRVARSTRDLILDAAERCFAERGFAGVSVRAIAGEAGLKNQASLYHHFRDKRALYEAVLSRGIGTVLGFVAEAGAAGERTTAGTPRVDLERLLDYLSAHPQLPHLIQRAAIDGSRQLRDTATRLLRPLYAQGVNIILSTSGSRWEQTDLPHLGAGLYHLIFGYFADAALIEAVAQVDPYSPAVLARQRRFITAAVSLLLGAPSGRTPRRRRTA